MGFLRVLVGYITIYSFGSAIVFEFLCSQIKSLVSA